MKYILDKLTHVFGKKKNKMKIRCVQNKITLFLKFY